MRQPRQIDNPVRRTGIGNRRVRPERPALCNSDSIALLFMHLYGTIGYLLVRKHQSDPARMHGFDWNDLKFFLSIAGPAS